jgi:hypothetical protein
VATAEMETDPKLGFLKRIFKRFGWSIDSKTAKCRDCRTRKLKTEMIHKPRYGYFCDETHWQEHYETSIW